MSGERRATRVSPPRSSPESLGPTVHAPDQDPPPHPLTPHTSARLSQSWFIAFARQRARRQPLPPEFDRSRAQTRAGGWRTAAPRWAVSPPVAHTAACPRPSDEPKVIDTSTEAVGEVLQTSPAAEPSPATAAARSHRRVASPALSVSSVFLHRTCV